MDSSALAERLGADLDGPGDVGITGINALEDAGHGDITFITKPKMADRWASSGAAAAIVSRSAMSEALRDGRALLVVDDAEIACITVLEMFAPPQAPPDVGVHATAWVHDDAVIGSDVRIGAHVSVDRNAGVGDGVTLHPGVRLYADSNIGDGSTLHANVVVRERCTVGRACEIHSNVSIGSDGFGYRPSPDGRGLLKVPQIGHVEIGDGVEIGAGTTIDRGKFGATIIGDGTKIDNLVQVGHNVRIGMATVIAAGTAHRRVGADRKWSSGGRCVCLRRPRQRG